jgi:hypothetical protein
MDTHSCIRTNSVTHLTKIVLNKHFLQALFVSLFLLRTYIDISRVPQCSVKKWYMAKKYFLIVFSLAQFRVAAFSLHRRGDGGVSKLKHKDQKVGI